MNKTWIAGALIMALLAGKANAQTDKEIKKARKEKAVVNAKQIEVADKAALTKLRALKDDDKRNGTPQDVKEDRKDIQKAHAKIMNAELKKDVAKVKKVL